MNVQLSYIEENYLKAIYHIGNTNGTETSSTNGIADHLGIKPATVTAMLKKLRDKQIVTYQRYGKVSLTQTGREYALQVVRKHRLWEVFLVDKLNFTWDEVHEVAEQLEHIQSQKLIHELDAFLNYPEFDPHGDPIPDHHGHIKPLVNILLADAQVGCEYRVAAVDDASSDFLQYLMQLEITLNTLVEVIRRFDFDQSVLLRINGRREITVSEKFTQHILLRKTETN